MANSTKQVTKKVGTRGPAFDAQLIRAWAADQKRKAIELKRKALNDATDNYDDDVESLECVLKEYNDMVKELTSLRREVKSVCSDVYKSYNKMNVERVKHGLSERDMTSKCERLIDKADELTES